MKANRRAGTGNSSLWVGLSLAILVALVAAFGPLVAPRDPLQENYVAQIAGRFIRPPFPPGVEGYPLGADEFGRDILSRLLWAVRPTLVLALVAAALRTAAGLAIGLFAGWMRGRPGRLLDELISGALSMPVLFVTLFAVAALARRWGVWAFILGLSLTGWAETARIVQQRARMIKGQPYIEAAWAMGGTDGQIAFSHVIPHVLPYLWIQMAFEISSALLTTAALGFLGYFINAVWIPVEDWVGLRVSGAPELSQMIGASVVRQPWTAVFAGTLVFLIVLAFNLLGEGLRLQFLPENRRAHAEKAAGKNGAWLEERLYLAVTEWRRTAATLGAFGALAAAVLGGSWVLWRAQASSMEASRVPVPGGQQWAAEMRDAQGSFWSPARGPAEGNVLWEHTLGEGLTGGPVIDAQGRLFAASADRKVFLVSPDGEVREIGIIPAGSVGWPALAPDGSVVVADVDGGLSALSAEGVLRWHYISDPLDAGLTGPVISAKGNIYYVLKDFIVAVDPQGKRLWQVLLPTYGYSSPLPRLTLDEKYLIFEDFMYDAESGALVFRATAEPMDRYVVGADGKTYHATPDSFEEWRETEKGAALVPQVKMDARLLLSGSRAPFLVGVSPGQQSWLVYSSPYEYMRLVWAAQKGSALQITDLPYRRGRLIGMDSAGTGYICGLAENRRICECRAVRMATGEVLWKADLKTSAEPVGGAIVEGRLYVAAEDGTLAALGSQPVR